MGQCSLARTISDGTRPMLCHAAPAFLTHRKPHPPITQHTHTRTHSGQARPAVPLLQGAAHDPQAQRPRLHARLPGLPEVPGCVPQRRQDSRRKPSAHPPPHLFFSTHHLFTPIRSTTTPPPTGAIFFPPAAVLEARVLDITCHCCTQAFFASQPPSAANAGRGRGRGRGRQPPQPQQVGGWA